MRIAEGKDVKLGYMDIEAFLELFDVGIYDPDAKKWYEFEVSAYKNELYSFVKFYLDNIEKFDYLVTFNGVSYDQQVLQYVIVHYQEWHDLTGLEVCKKISDYSGKIIEDMNYNLPSIYKEYHFPIKPIDLFKIHHFDNDAKKTSLKWCEFMMDMSVEEMPIHFLSTGITEEQIKEIRFYRRHDVIATGALLYVTLGDINGARSFIKEHLGYEPKLDSLGEVYEGKNKVQDRFDVMNETGMKCLNWSDVKIGEEWNKHDYMVELGIKDERQLYPDKVKQPYGQKFKNFFPKTMKFTTDTMNKFITDLGEEYVRAKRKGEKVQEFKLKYGKTTYTIAKGGIHSNEKNRKFIPAPGFILRDADVGSQYPNSILKLRIYAPHLVDIIIGQFKGKVSRRIDLKLKAKVCKANGELDMARFYTSVQEMLKLCMNGGLTNLVL